MKKYYVDLHIQSRYTASATKDITVKNLARQARIKGLNIIGTGDCLHPKWREELERELQYSDGIYEKEGIYFIPSVEIKDKNRVHHLIFLETLKDFDRLYNKWKEHGKLDKIGVPTIHLDGEQITKEVFDLNGIIGPAHIFVPWESMYKSFDSINDCYGEFSSKITFIELGLSADTYMADTIRELKEKVFLSNSDNHSLNTLGREFNEFFLEKPTFEEIRKALENKGGRKVTLNVGLDPREGKYYLSACIKCHSRYRYEDATRLKWKCEKCGGIIRKGVKDRVSELSSYKKPKHPEFRPPYIHMLPLSEIIKMCYPHANNKEVKERKNGLIERFGSELSILLHVNISELCKADEKIGEVLEKIRNGKLNFVPGGGGKFGEPTFDEVDEDLLFYKPKFTQRRLFE